MQNNQAIIALQTAVKECASAYSALENAQGTRNRAADAALQALCAVAVAIKQAATPAERQEIQAAGYAALAELPKEAQKGLLDSRLYHQGDYITLGQFVNIDDNKQIIGTHKDASAQAFVHWPAAENGVIYPKPQGGKKLPAKQAFDVCLQASGQYEQAEKIAKPDCLKVQAAFTIIAKLALQAGLDAVKVATLQDLANEAFQKVMKADADNGKIIGDAEAAVKKAADAMNKPFEDKRPKAAA